jgi:epoxyqueuosine reductase
MISFDSINSCAKQLALQVVGATNVMLKENARNSLALWQEQGFAGQMQYMQRSPGGYCDVTSLLPEAQAVISCAVFYERSASPQRPQGFGRVARYAWGRDYHKVLRKRLEQFAEKLKIDFKVNARVFTDAVPIMERAFAGDAALGFIGKNTMLIRDHEGSFSLLGEVIIDQKIENTPATSSRGSCGSCTSCLSNCPTEAIVSEYKIDARKCISYLTIEKRGPFNGWEMKALGEWIFGCDICQEVCPFNSKSLKQQRESSWAEFSRSSGVGPLLNLSQVLSLKSDQQFLRAFQGTALMRPKREGLIRNALCVIANTGAVELVPLVIEARQSDASPVVRETARAALQRLNQEYGAVPKSVVDRLL